MPRNQFSFFADTYVYRVLSQQSSSLATDPEIDTRYRYIHLSPPLPPSPMRIERTYLRNYDAANGTRACIYDCISLRWTCRYRITDVHTYNTPSRSFLATSGHLYHPLDASLRSSTKNYVAHHGKRKVKRSRPSGRVIFLFLTAEKTIETSNYADREKNVKYKYGLLDCCSPRSFSFSSLPPFPRTQSARSSRRDSIIAALSATLFSTRPYSIVKRESPNDPRRIMRFIILMWQPAKQDFNDTSAVNSRSSCSRIILGGIIHFALDRESL